MLPGILISFFIACVATASQLIPFPPFTLHNNVHPLEPILVAMILGIIVSNTMSIPSRFNSGIVFSQKKILNVAIILLGSQMSFSSVTHFPTRTLALLVLLPLLILFLGIFIGKKFHLSSSSNRLIAIGTAVCGSSAIAAAAPIIDAKQKDIAISIACVNLLGLIAVFLFPLLGQTLKLSSTQFGFWAGISIQAVPQVVATGISFSPAAGNIATVIKLMRVCLLGPFLILLRLLTPQTHSKAKTRWHALVPPFIIGFFIMMTLRSTHILQDIQIANHNISIISTLGVVSHFLMAMALAAVGLKTHLSHFRQTGGRTLLLATILFVLLATMSYLTF